MNKDEILAKAKKEIKEEEFRKAVDEQKKKIKAKKWHHKFFPWKLSIIRRD